jgi:hypothetical protein
MLQVLKLKCSVTDGYDDVLQPMTWQQLGMQAEQQMGMGPCVASIDMAAAARVLSGKEMGANAEQKQPGH